MCLVAAPIRDDCVSGAAGEGSLMLTCVCIGRNRMTSDSQINGAGCLGHHATTSVLILRAWVNKNFGSRNVDTLTCQPFSCPCQNTGG
jgi:hypothetical protein